MRSRDQWIEWIRAVERESEAAALAVELLDERLRVDPSSMVSRGLEQRDVDHVRANREATHLVRAFAVFESGLRDAWRVADRKATSPKIADLMAAFAARTRMPNDRLADAHRVRVYRNSIVHDLTEPVEPMSLAEARRFLCRFFSYLPPDWQYTAGGAKHFQSGGCGDEQVGTTLVGCGGIFQRRPGFLFGGARR